MEDERKVLTTTNFADRYLDQGLRYDFWLTPEDVPNFEAALQRGINCYLLARIALQENYGLSLPTGVRCTELYQDNTHFDRVTLDPDNVELKPLDLVWFGRPGAEKRISTFVPDYDDSGNLRNFQTASPVSHVAIATGKNASGDPLLLHAVAKQNVTIWPLSRFKTVARYSTLQGMSRIRQDSLTTTPNTLTN